MHVHSLEGKKICLVLFSPELVPVAKVELRDYDY